jgi:signal transduction histidine kinase
LNGLHCKLFVIQDVTHVMNQQRLLSENKYQQLIVATMAHEYLTPLNALLNLS